MSSFNAAITFIGFVYGIVLILATFIDNSILEKFRIDAMFIPNPSHSTRKLNLIFGLFVIGYNGYALFKSIH